MLETTRRRSVVMTPWSMLAEDVVGEPFHLIQRPPDGELAVLQPERREGAEQQDDQGGRSDDDPVADVLPQGRELGVRRGTRAGEPAAEQAVLLEDLVDGGGAEHEGKEQRDDDDHRRR